MTAVASASAARRRAPLGLRLGVGPQPVGEGSAGALARQVQPGGRDRVVRLGGQHLGELERPGAREQVDVVAAAGETIQRPAAASVASSPISRYDRHSPSSVTCRCE